MAPQDFFVHGLFCFIFISFRAGLHRTQERTGYALVIAIIFLPALSPAEYVGEKFIKRSMLPPYIGMWLAVIVLTPVIITAYKAMHDSQL